MIKQTLTAAALAAALATPAFAQQSAPMNSAGFQRRYDGPCAHVDRR